MRKRRVGVTARLRRTEEKQATDFPQVDSEMAAPPELRTPMGTAVEAENECGWKRGDSGARVDRQKTVLEMKLGRGKSSAGERATRA
jgi:hypothetical protein